MGESHWVRDFSPGWGNTLLDFLAWQRKIMGSQHIVLARGFYASRYIHIVEGLYDLPSVHTVPVALLRQSNLEGGRVKRSHLSPIYSGGPRRNFPQGRPVLNHLRRSSSDRVF